MFALTTFCVGKVFGDGSPNLYNILSAVTLDLAVHGNIDRAILINNEQTESVDLQIYFVSHLDPATNMKTIQKTIFPNITRSGGSLNPPALGATDNYSFTLTTSNMGSSSIFWVQKLTISRRDNDYHVIGYTFSQSNAANGRTIECDVNLMTKRVVKNGRELTTSSGVVKLANWKDELKPKECN